MHYISIFTLFRFSLFIVPIPSFHPSKQFLSLYAFHSITFQSSFNHFFKALSFQLSQTFHSLHSFWFSRLDFLSSTNVSSIQFLQSLSQLSLSSLLWISTSCLIGIDLNWISNLETALYATNWHSSLTLLRQFNSINNLSWILKVGIALFYLSTLNRFLQNLF